MKTELGMGQEYQTPQFDMLTTNDQSSEGTNYKTLLVPRSIELEWSMVIIQQDPSIVDQSKNHLTRWPNSEKPTGVAHRLIRPESGILDA